MLATASSKIDTKSDSKPTPAILPTIVKLPKRDLYIKVFAQEFVRELEYLWDVANKRAVARDKFTTQLAALLTAAAPYVPAGSAAAVFATAVEFAANQVRDKETLSVANLRDQLDLPRLNLIADVVAREAYRRYEFFIINRLSDQAEDGVIPFAKVGVARVLEHLARKRGGAALSKLLREKLTPVLGDAKRDPKNDILVELSESFLLAGLVEGRSGSFVQGFSNNEIKLNRTEKNIVGAVKTATVDAEDVYARSGLMHFEIKQGNLTPNIYRRSTGRHQEGSAGEQLKRLFKGETESLYGFGYAKYSTEKGREWDPVCGYAIMPLSVIEQRYDFKPHGQTHKVSHELESELQRQSLSVVPIDKETFKQYIAWCRKDIKNSKHTVADYLRMQKIWLGAQWVVCQEDLSELNLQGLNLSRMDLSSSTLSGDLTGTQFVESYLISTRFVKVTSAKQTNFRQAHCAYLKADGVDFTDSDFTQADCSFAKLRKAKLVRCKALGTTWYETDLREIESDVDLLKEQEKQLKQLAEDTKQQRAELHAVKDAAAQQQTKLQELTQQVVTLIQAKNQATGDDKTIQHAIQKNQAQLTALQETVAEIIQQQENQQIFIEYCRHTVRKLQYAIQTTASQEDVSLLQEQLQTTHLQMTSLQQKNTAVIQHVQLTFTQQINQLGNQYADIKQKLAEIPEQFTQVLAVIEQQQTQRCKAITKHIQQVEEKLQQKIIQLGMRVDTLEWQFNQLQQELAGPADALRHVMTILKQHYIRFNSVERLADQKRLPIEQSYINLAITEEYSQQSKERKLEQRDEKNSDAKNTVKDLQEARSVMLGSYEDLYGTKKAITVADIFKSCDKKSIQRLLVLGRAGIGKSTFCQYVTQQWATGWLWQAMFDGLVWIPLRRLNGSRYPVLPAGQVYHLVDVIEKEYGVILPTLAKNRLQEQLDKNNLLWLLDGYDELASPIPAQLQYVVKQLLNMPRQILTSRPYYTQSLQYDVQLEITGFTDENIEAYIKRFFEPVKELPKDHKTESKNTVSSAITSQYQALINFLKADANLWGIAHIPINLELICSVWSAQPIKATTITITILYQIIVTWLLKRHCQKQEYNMRLWDEEALYETCQAELAVLEHLAFHAMQNNTLILDKTILPTVLKQIEPSSKLRSVLASKVLNVGILKAFTDANDQLTELEKEYYFIHLTFQEFLAARYVVNSLRLGKGERFNAATDFIRDHKYDRRQALVFWFASGLLITDKSAQGLKPLQYFWQTLQSAPRDWVGVYHQQLVIACLNEAQGDNRLPEQKQGLQEIKMWLGEDTESTYLSRAPYVARMCQTKAERAATALIESKTMSAVLETKNILFKAYNDEASYKYIDLIKKSVKDLGYLGAVAATPDILQTLLEIALNNLEREYTGSRWNSSLNNVALQSLSKMGPSAVQILCDQVINPENGEMVREELIKTLCTMEVARISGEVLKMLCTLAVNDNSMEIRQSAINALDELYTAVAIPYMEPLQLLCTLAVNDDSVEKRRRAIYALKKINIAASVPLTQQSLLKVISTDKDERCRIIAVDALGNTEEKASHEIILALSDIIISEQKKQRRLEKTDSKLAIIQPKEDDENNINRYELIQTTIEVIGRIGAPSAISKILAAFNDIVLHHPSSEIKKAAIEALGNMSSASADRQVLNALCLIFLKIDSQERYDAITHKVLKAFQQMGAAVATTEVFHVLCKYLIEYDDHETSYEILKTFEVMGHAAARSTEVTTTLRKLALDKFDSSAAKTLGIIGASDILKQVTQAWLLLLQSNQKNDIRIKAIQTFGYFFSYNTCSVLDLIPEVFDALFNIIINEKNAFKNRLKNPDAYRVYCAVIEVLGKVNNPVKKTSQNTFILNPKKEVVQVLLTLLQDWQSDWDKLIQKREEISAALNTSDEQKATADLNNTKKALKAAEEKVNEELDAIIRNFSTHICVVLANTDILVAPTPSILKAISLDFASLYRNSENLLLPHATPELFLTLLKYRPKNDEDDLSAYQALLLTILYKIEAGITPEIINWLYKPYSDHADRFSDTGCDEFFEKLPIRSVLSRCLSSPKTDCSEALAFLTCQQTVAITVHQQQLILHDAQGKLVLPITITNKERTQCYLDALTDRVAYRRLPAIAEITTHLPFYISIKQWQDYQEQLQILLLINLFGVENQLNKNKISYTGKAEEISTLICCFLTKNDLVVKSSLSVPIASDAKSGVKIFASNTVTINAIKRSSSIFSMSAQSSKAAVVFQAILDDKTMSFTEQDAKAADALTLLNTTHKQVASSLALLLIQHTDEENESEVHKKLGQDIRGFALRNQLTTVLSEPQVKKMAALRDAYQQAQQEGIVLMESEGSGEELLAARSKMQAADKALIQYCQSNAIIGRYLNQGIEQEKLPLGLQAALLYAKQQNVNFYVWRKKSKTPNELECVSRHQENNTAAATTLHFLDKGNGNYGCLIVAANNPALTTAATAPKFNY